MKTNFDTLIGLSTHIINHLQQQELIEYGIDMRSQLIDTLATELGASFATDENIVEQALEEIEEKFGPESLPEDVTESEIFNHARKEIIKSYNGENIGGLYLVESLHNIAIRIKDFLLECDLIEEVYLTDQEIIEYLVQAIRTFKGPRAQMGQTPQQA